MANDKQSQPPAIIRSAQKSLDRAKSTSPGRELVDVLRYSGIKRMADAARFGPRGKRQRGGNGRS